MVLPLPSGLDRASTHASSWNPASLFPWTAGGENFTAVDTFSALNPGLLDIPANMPGQSTPLMPLQPLVGAQNRSQEDFVPTTKKTTMNKTRSSKPLTVEDLVHDKSRFAKVVKAFLSIEDESRRTVPEIAKRVDEMHPNRYNDFESVKVSTLVI